MVSIIDTLMPYRSSQLLKTVDLFRFPGRVTRITHCKFGLGSIRTPSRRYICRHRYKGAGGMSSCLVSLVSTSSSITFLGLADEFSQGTQHLCLIVAHKMFESRLIFDDQKRWQGTYIVFVSKLG